MAFNLSLVANQRRQARHAAREIFALSAYRAKDFTKEELVGRRVREIKDLDKQNVKLYGFMMPLDQSAK